MSKSSALVVPSNPQIISEAVEAQVPTPAPLRLLDHPPNRERANARGCTSNRETM